MLTLIGKRHSENFIEIQKRLDDLTVSYQMQYTSDRPYLQDGKLIIKGSEEISTYLKELDDELQRWYYCSV